MANMASKIPIFNKLANKMISKIRIHIKILIKKGKDKINFTNKTQDNHTINHIRHRISTKQIHFKKSLIMLIPVSKKMFLPQT
jgi:alpha-D-ribose 1-methylphosphonate 5-phosphate C-P lyase